MVNITKVYTKQGDQGQTSLAGGQRLTKDEPRMQCIGYLDELNAYLGWALTSLDQGSEHATIHHLNKMLLAVQHQLFDAGAQLAILPEDQRDNTPRLLQRDIDHLEQSIDQLNESLPKLTSFILPGGGEASCRFHIARSVCRHLERSLVTFNQTDDELDPLILSYVNRLSDWLFVAARAVAQTQDYSETLWQSELRQ